MLPDLYLERFNALMDLYNEQTAKKLKEGYSIGSAEGARRGMLHSSVTNTLYQRCRIQAITDRASAIVEIHKKLLPLFNIDFSESLPTSLKQFVRSSMPENWCEQLLEENPPQHLETQATLANQFLEELRAVRNKSVRDAELEIDLLVDAIRAKSLSNKQSQDAEIAKKLASIILIEHQKELLLKLVEAEHSVPREQRRKFILVASSTVLHPGLSPNLPANLSDIEALEDAELIRLAVMGTASPNFSITPLGFKYAQWLQGRSGQPLERVSEEARSYLDSKVFRERYPRAYERWTHAEASLWGEDSANQLTTIGHIARESLQEFAGELIERCRVPDAESVKTQTISRIRAVLNFAKSRSSSSEHAFLDALMAYWGTVNDLVQRQEHGAHKEGDALTWEDARRVVFQTIIVMYEIDRALIAKK